MIEQNKEQMGDEFQTPEITEDMQTSIRRMMHSEKVMERLVAIASSEAPEQAEAEAVDEPEPESEPEAESDSDSDETDESEDTQTN